MYKGGFIPIKGLFQTSWRSWDERLEWRGMYSYVEKRNGVIYIEYITWI